MDFAVFTMGTKLGCCFAQGIEPASALVSTMAITIVLGGS